MYTIEVIRRYQYTNDCEGETLKCYTTDTEEDGLQWLLDSWSFRDADYTIMHMDPGVTFGQYVNEGDLEAVEYEVSVLDETLDRYTDAILKPFVEAMTGGCRKPRIV